MSRSSFARLSSSRSLLSDENSYNLNDIAPSEETTGLPFEKSSFFHTSNAKDHSNIPDRCSEGLSNQPHSDSEISEQPKRARTPPSITRSVLLRKPISQSTIMPISFRDRNTKTDELLALHRREKAIQADIQHLIDAHFAALLLGYNDKGENLSEVSSRSTDKKLEKAGFPKVIPVRQPKKHPTGLREARDGLATKMEELIYVKREELIIYEYEISKRGEAISIADNWQTKLIKLNEQLSSYSSDGNTEPRGDKGTDDDFTRLMEEEKTVLTKIRLLEDKLSQLKARRESIRRRIDESANKKEARLSSYRGALWNAEAEIKEFLKNPPVSNSLVKGDENSFTSVPVSKRSLVMAIECWKKELSQAILLKQKAEIEEEALEEGILIWEASIQIIIDLERDMRRKLKCERMKNIADFKDQIMKMNSIITKLEENLHTATSKGWNLLICAIGAELEALERGKNILNKSVAMSENTISLENIQLNSTPTNQFFYNIDGDEDIRLSLERKLTEEAPEKSSFHSHIRDSE